MDRTKLMKKMNLKHKNKAKLSGGPKTNRTRHMALRVTEPTAKAVEQAAYDTHRTNSNWIECAILWALKCEAIQAVPRPEDQ